MQNNLNNLISEFQQLISEPERERKTVQYPAPFLTISHQQGVWVLTDRATKESIAIGKDIEVATTQTFIQSKIFTSAGILKAISQIVLPSERKNMLDIISGTLWDNVEIDEGDTAINSWIIPVVIVSNNYSKALWEVKRTSLKSVINFLQENNLRNLNGLQLKLSLLARRDGSMKKWSEPKILSYSTLAECKDEKLLSLALEFVKNFHEFRKQYNLQAIQSNEDVVEL